MAVPQPSGSWPELAVDQLRFHWEQHLRPRLEDLLDDEYFWEPVSGCWSIRRRGETEADLVGGSGEWVLELDYPEPDPPPVTTIAWRLAHLAVPCLGMRNAKHLEGPPCDFFDHEYPGTAAGALRDLDAAYRYWVEGISSLPPERFDEPVGEAEGPFAEYPFAGLVLHINREVIHHGAEILLLRDLYAHR
jgi:hypothetical protein